MWVINGEIKKKKVTKFLIKMIKRGVAACSSLPPACCRKKRGEVILLFFFPEGEGLRSGCHS